MGLYVSKHQRIIDLALEFNYWIYGGYVRDSLVGDQFNDLDFGCSMKDSITISNFISKLRESWKVTIKFDSMRDTDLTYSKSIQFLKL
jgi:tRNA nucleotidyltransferase/poly(A) polymerase